MKRSVQIGGALWSTMDKRKRISLKLLRKTDIPDAAGVYAFYRDGERMYGGKASILSDRIWNNHCGRGAVMTSSAPRRDIAQQLNILTSADINTRRYQPNSDEVATIRLWLDVCEVAWLECGSPLAAEQLGVASKLSTCQH